MHTEDFELTEYWKDKTEHERLGNKIYQDWNKKGEFYKDDADRYMQLWNKLTYHQYPTYRVLQYKYR